MNNSETKNLNCRFENKAMLNTFNVSELGLIVKSHPALFSEIHQGRYVNNIYFDSANLDHYFDNVDGVSRRGKIRVRWYGDMEGVLLTRFWNAKKSMAFMLRNKGTPSKVSL